MVDFKPASCALDWEDYVSPSLLWGQASLSLPAVLIIWIIPCQPWCEPQSGQCNVGPHLKAKCMRLMACHGQHDNFWGRALLSNKDSGTT